MTETSETAVESAGGYLSEDHKRRFTVTAGVLGAVFFFGQLVLPIVIMFTVMPFWMMSTTARMRIVEVPGSALWRGDLWYVETSVAATPAATGPEVRTIYRVPATAQGEPQPVARIEAESPWLLAGDDRLWLVASDRVGIVRGDELETVWHGRDIGSVARPLLLEGRPAAIVRDPEGYALQVFDTDGWHERHRFDVRIAGEPPSIDDELQLVTVRGELFVFMRVDGMLYARNGLPPADGEPGADPWQVVGRVGVNWAAAVIDGVPAVFDIDAPANRMRGRRLDHGEWTSFLTLPMIAMGDMAVLDDEVSGSFMVVTGGFPSSMTVRVVRDGTVVERVQHGSGFPFPRSFLAMMLVPHLGTVAMPLILALVLSSLMPRHRVVRFVAGGRSAPYASLARRGFAQAVDALLVGGPVVVAGIIAFSHLFDFEALAEGDLPGVLAAFAFVPAALLWLVIWFVVFGITEGVWGTSPGKWLLGVRVMGTDLRPCGVGRGLLRNLLKFVDGFFNFMVGVMVVALSEKWQRVGDMAARTVVVSAHIAGDDEPGV